jgi:type IV secretory pathway VirD2 relaxase
MKIYRKHEVARAAELESLRTCFALHGDEPSDPVLGRLVERGLDDELKGSAYIVIDGVDGRTHHRIICASPIWS